jgi:hypothetical protein
MMFGELRVLEDSGRLKRYGAKMSLAVCLVQCSCGVPALLGQPLSLKATDGVDI